MTDIDINKAGKRYTCSTCGCQVMCTKGGAGRVSCHGQPMELHTSKPLPSSD
jgi:hypothetical protein